MNDMKIALIGGGNMGEVMLSALLNKGLSPPQDITVSDINQARCQYLRQQYSVTVASSNQEAITKGEVVLLAIKPQNLAKVMAELGGHFKSTQLVLSIIAGAKVNTLRLGLKHSRVVRAMPNMPARVGQGISVWTATAEVTEQQREWASTILGAMGKAIYVDDEKYIDMATAVSGSGPAYFFLMVESLVDAAVSIGIPHHMAQELVLQTLLGSGQVLQKSDKSAAELRKMVTSPGGTTAEALLQFEKGKFHTLVMKAVSAAYNKAKQLGS